MQIYLFVSVFLPIYLLIRAHLYYSFALCRTYLNVGYINYTYLCLSCIHPPWRSQRVTQTQLYRRLSGSFRNLGLITEYPLPFFGDPLSSHTAKPRPLLCSSCFLEVHSLHCTPISIAGLLAFFSQVLKISNTWVRWSSLPTYFLVSPRSLPISLQWRLKTSYITILPPSRSNVLPATSHFYFLLASPCFIHS